MRQKRIWDFKAATLGKKMSILGVLLINYLIAGAFAGQALAGEFLDPGTQYQIYVPFSDSKGTYNIHICGGNAFMVGVHIGRNQFLCEDNHRYKSISGIQTNNIFSGTHIVRYSRQGMASCEPGFAMVGLHAGNNVLLCARLPTKEPFIDASTQRHGMHACPLFSYMVGIHVGRNLLLCAEPLY
jgi:hypothetical protein